MSERIVAAKPEAPKFKYYHAENSNRMLRSDGFRFAFDPYQHLGGTWWGIYRTADPKEQAALDKLVADRKTAVTAITAEQYEICVKKKFKLSQSSGVLAPPPVQAEPWQAATGSPLIPLAAPTAGAPVSSELPTPAPAEVKPLEKAADALSVGPVTTVQSAGAIEN